MMNASLPTSIFAVGSKLLKAKIWQPMFSRVEKKLARFMGLQVNGHNILYMQRGKTIMSYCNTLLTLLNEDEFAGQCSEIQYFLAEIDRDRMKEGRRAKLEHALIYCQQALQEYTRKNLLIAQGMMQIVSGFLYIELGTAIGEPEEMYERALKCYLHAELIFTEETFPLQWATVQQCLSTVYIMRVQGNKKMNLQQAIIRGQSSLRLFTRSTYPLEWARTHTYLAEAYRQATDHENLCVLYSGRSSMQEQALRHLEAALQICTLEKYPLEWAKIQHFLGMIYLERVRGRRSDNLEQARESFEAALPVFQCEFSSSDCAAIHELLASISLAVNDV
jgi:tetratricopeptide (TPR) repeat protein